MTTSPVSTGPSTASPIGGRLLPLESGVLPPDFPQRLVRLKEASGLTWTAFAHAMGVDRKQVLRWTKGVEPCGGAMLALLRFAMRIPGGLEILMGEGFQVVFWEKEDLDPDPDCPSRRRPSHPPAPAARSPEL